MFSQFTWMTANLGAFQIFTQLERLDFFLQRVICRDTSHRSWTQYHQYHHIVCIICIIYSKCEWRTAETIQWDQTEDAISCPPSSFIFDPASPFRAGCFSYIQQNWCCGFWILLSDPVPLLSGGKRDRESQELKASTQTRLWAFWSACNSPSCVRASPHGAEKKPHAVFY